VLEPRARQPEHRRALVDGDHPFRARGEELGHAAGPGADVEHAPDRVWGKRLDQGIFHHLVGAVKAAQLVPLAGMRGEIILRFHLARGADRGQLAAVVAALPGIRGGPCRHATRHSGPRPAARVGGGAGQRRHCARGG
jgi:hypothetical protein